jgi:predicted nucleic acid-binding protein
VARYLADTSAWRRSQATSTVAARWAELVEFDEIAMCPPVRLELLYSSRGPADHRILAAELDGLEQFALLGGDAERALVAQGLLATRSQHRGPPPVDLLVAAIAERAGLTVLHYDRHFDAIARVTGQPAEWLARRGSLY